MSDGAKPDGDARPSRLREQILGLPVEQRTERIFVYLQKQIAGQLNISPEAVVMTTELDRLAVDSLVAADLSQEFEDDLDCEVSPTIVFEHETVGELAGALGRSLANASDGSHATALPAKLSFANGHPGDLPLTSGQRRLWFLDRLVGRSPLYNLHVAIRMHGDLDEPALRRSLNDLFSRHDSFHCTFPTVDGEPVQRIGTSSLVVPQLVDLSAHSSANRDREFERIRRNHASQIFDLGSGPLVAVSLIRLDPGNHVLLLTQHHIATDGWSLGVCLQELSKQYRAHTEGDPGELPAAPSLSEFVDAECAREQTSALDRSRGYWKEQLTGLPPLDLPTDMPRHRGMEFPGGRHHFVVDPELVAALKSLGVTHRCTLYSVLLSVYAVTLYRHCGQEDMGIAGLVANRNARSNARLIAFMVNTLVLRCDLSARPTFTELLGRIGKTVREGLDHQKVPFDEVVRENSPVRNPAENPLFRTAFVLENLPLPDVELPGMVWEPMLYSPDAAIPGFSKFELSLSMRERGDVLEGCIEYRSDLFEERTIRGIASHFERLLHEVVADPTRCVDAIPIMTNDERAMVLEHWNRTDSPFPPKHCVHELFESQAAQSQDSVAIEFGSDRLRYAQLEERANQLAHYLKRLNNVGGRIGICLHRSLDLIVALLATWKAGLAYVPLDPDFPETRLAFMIKDAGLGVVVQDQTQLELAADGVQVVSLSREREAISALPVTPPSVSTNSSDVAYVIYTSGSTGRPKGVAITHSALVNFLFAMDQLLALGPQDRFLALTSISFDIAGLEIYLPLLRGSRLCVAPGDTLRDGRRLDKLFAAHQPTIVQGTPATYRILLDAGWEPERSLRILCGGEALPLHLARTLSAASDEMWNLYGPTETTIWSLASRVRPGDERVSIGRPIANTRTYVLDDRLEPVPAGVVGELFIGGAGVAKEYLERPEMTAARFLRDPFVNDPAARMYRTGDLVRQRADGSFDFIGRNDDQLKVRGFRIEPAEIEAQLDGLSSIRRSVVVTHSTSNADARLLAYLTGDSSKRPSNEQLRMVLAGSLPDPLIPDAFIWLDEFPLTPNGKVDRKALPAPERATLLGSGELRKARDQLEREIAEIWAEVLDIGEVGIADGFFDLGGTSLLSVRLVERLRKETGADLELVDLFNYPTVERLADRIRGTGRVGIAPAARGHAVSGRGEGVAIVGMACRFPGGAVDADSLWELMERGEDAIGEVEAERWDWRRLSAPEPGKSGARWGGFLPNIDEFDAGFFNMSPGEANYLDPQQRLLLEVSWEAIENAGYAAQKLRGARAGVFVGNCTSDYGSLILEQGLDHLSRWAGSGNAGSMSAGRLSHRFEFHGPSFSVDTACSSSLVAIHLACQSLDAGECDMALAGGVNLVLSPHGGLYFSMIGAMSPDGRCKSFDASADGYVRSDGCGMLMLKPLERALDEGDPVVAVIRGSAVNHDGRSTSLTAPNGLAQERVIREAIHNAGLEPDDIDYVESHGTGTELGDPIEMHALAEAFDLEHRSRDPLVVGSVKSNIGHSEAAAGVAGVIKTVLALQRESIPQNLHFANPSPHIPWDRWSVVVPAKPQAWCTSEVLRRAGVSSFGFSGTNAHLVLEEAPALSSECNKPDPPHHVLALSGRTGGALRNQAEKLGRHIHRHPEIDVADVCRSANTGRVHFERRRGLVCSSREELLEQLGQMKHWQQDGEPPARRAASSRRAFLFTGQGAQYFGMGRGLYEQAPNFRRVVDHCEELFLERIGDSLLEVIYGSAPRDRINETLYTQTALFAVQCGLAELWRGWGVEPDFVLGHSVGEYAAAVTAGIFDMEAGFRLLIERASLMQSLPAGGAMVHVRAPAAVVAARFEDMADLSIAAMNAPEETVVSGGRAEIAEVSERFRVDGIAVRALNVSHAFHSQRMDPVLERFREFAGATSFSPAQIPFVSSSTGKLEEGGFDNGDYWTDQIREPVRFADAMTTLSELGASRFLELGPHPVLTAIGRKTISGGGEKWCASLREGREDWNELLHSLASVYEDGTDVDWDEFHRPWRGSWSALPTYAFQRQRHWIAAGETSATPTEMIQEQLNSCVELVWQPNETNPIERTTGAARSWLVLGDRGGVAQDTARLLEAAGDFCVLVAPPPNGKAMAACLRTAIGRVKKEKGRLDGVIHGWSLDADIPEAATAAEIWRVAESGCRSTLELIQQLDAAGDSPRIWWLTRGAVAAAKPASNAAGGLVWGLAAAVALEHPEQWGGLIDLSGHPTELDPAHVERELQSLNPEGRVAYRDGVRHTPRLERSTLERTTVQEFDPNATYLITGGLGDLGLCVARWMVGNGARHLALVGRNRPRPEAEEARRELERTGASVQFLTTDVSDQDETIRLVSGLRAEKPPLRGIIHAAGVIEDGLLVNQDWASFERVLAPKIIGAWNLHRATLTDSLDFFVSFSSIGATLGSPGQGNYCAANGFLDSMAQYRQFLGLPAESIAWGPWDDIGMAARRGDGSSRRSAGRGIGRLEPSHALSALGSLIASQKGHCLVAEMDWELLAERAEPTPMLAGLTGVSRTKPATAPDAKPLLSGSRDELPQRVKNYLRARISVLLGTELDSSSDDADLSELGMDSLVVMDLLQDLGDGLGIRLYPREVHQRPTLSEFSAYLASELISQRSVEAHAPPPTRLSAQEVEAPPSERSRVPTNSQNVEGPFVVLLSSPRAGSTLLRVMLAGHPEIFAPPELHLLAAEKMRGWADALQTSHLDEGLLRALMELRGIAADEAAGILNEMVERDIPVKQVCAQLREWAAGRVVVDKSPSTALNPEALARAEALGCDVRYIFLHRHPYAVIESHVRMRMHRLLTDDEVDPHRIAESIWSTSNSNVLDFLGRIDPRRWQRIAYEDLVAQPETVLRSICQFLDLPFDQGLLRPYDPGRMTEGAFSSSLSIGDPNFLNHTKIEPELAEAWRDVSLPHPIKESTQLIAADLGYVIPAERQTDRMSEVSDREAPSRPAVVSDDDRTGMREEFVQHGSQQLCVCRWGPARAPDVVLLHGILDQGASWEQIARQFADAGLAVAAPDLRGHGRSSHSGPNGSYGLFEYVADLDHLTEALEVGRALLVGHSLGAMVAALLTSARPERFSSMALIEGILPASQPGQLTRKRMARYLDARRSATTHPVLSDLDEAEQRMLRIWPRIDAKLARRLAERTLVPVEGGLQWSWDARLRTRADLLFGDGSFTREEFMKVLRELKLPVLLVSGSESEFGTLAQSTDAELGQLRVRRERLSGGHMLHFDVPQQLGDQLLRWQRAGASGLDEAHTAAGPEFA